MGSKSRALLLAFVFACLKLNSTQFVANTWSFQNATRTAWEFLTTEYGNAIDALVAGLAYCEESQCDFTVGPGGSPNENGDISLDAMLMDACTRDVGAVASMYNISSAVKVARKVLDETFHSLLVGFDATAFAVKMGFEISNLRTERTNSQWEQWSENGRQPNYWKHHKHINYKSSNLNKGHDTIGMITIDTKGNLACGTSTNGLKFKIPGRVGDSPLVGSGAYCEQEWGACVATGNGDVTQRFVPCAKAVFNMRYRGMQVQQACEDALADIKNIYPGEMVGLVCVSSKGEYAGAKTTGSFSFCVRDVGKNDVIVVHV